MAPHDIVSAQGLSWIM